MLYDFFHLFDGPAVRVLSACAKFKIFQSVVISNSILMMNREPIIPKPKHGLWSHWMLFIHHKPVFSYLISFCQRVSHHAQYHDVTSACFARMASVRNSTIASRLKASVTKLAESLFYRRRSQQSHFATNRTFERDALLKEFDLRAWRAQMRVSDDIPGSFEFVRAKQSNLSATRTRRWPYSVPVTLFVGTRPSQRFGLKLRGGGERSDFRHNVYLSDSDVVFSGARFVTGESSAATVSNLVLNAS